MTVCETLAERAVVVYGVAYAQHPTTLGPAVSIVAANLRHTIPTAPIVGGFL
jgi:hypothetical protein